MCYAFAPPVLLTRVLLYCCTTLCECPQKIVHEGSHTLRLETGSASGAGNELDSRQTGDQLARMLFDYVGRYIYFPLKWGGAAAEHTWPNMWFERREWPNGVVTPRAAALAGRARGGRKPRGGRPFFADARDGWMWCALLLLTVVAAPLMVFLS